MGQNFARNWLVPLSECCGTYMHNPASNNDKDPYEGKCHIRAQYVCVGGGGGGTLGSDVTLHLVGVFVIVWCRSMHIGAGLPGVPKKSSHVFQLFSKNAQSRNGKIGLGSNRFLNEDYICIYLNLVKCPDKVLETNR